VGIFRDFLFTADQIDVVQRQCFVLRLQEMAIAPQYAPRLDFTMLMQRCQQATDNAMQLPGEAP
jgi:hypothetical protein